MSTPISSHPALPVKHLEPALWAKANRHLIRKALCEFSHEQVFTPTLVGEVDASGWAYYHVEADQKGQQYRFTAKPMALRHWNIKADSIGYYVNDIESETPLDALSFIINFKNILGIASDKLPVYLDEISSTLFGSAYKQASESLPSADLVNANYQDFEAAMTEGHPGFVANNGRLGFNTYDYRAYAPETGSAFRIIWLAVHKDNAEFSIDSDFDYHSFMLNELGESTLAQFNKRLDELEVNREDYFFMPAHPWQWHNKIGIMFSADIANRKIIPLEESKDEYSAQQSIRTYFNLSVSERCYVKTSLSILNMGFMRGLSPYYMQGTPAINSYLDQLIKGDSVLQSYRFSILKEVASIGYRNRYYEAALDADNPCKKMLSALWRESPIPTLESNETLMTMAGLLHIDNQGTALIAELIKASTLTAEQWMANYLSAFLQPMLHCFYAHDLVFMPHCENLILVMENHVVTRVIMKDIAEESAILNIDKKLPKEIARLVVGVPHEYKILGIFIDIFDGVFRHMSAMLEDAGAMEESTFWRLVADSALEYQHQHPELAAKFEQHDFFAPEFLHSCLNRLQLKNNLQMVDLADPASSLIMADSLSNPIANFAPKSDVKATG